MDTLMTISAHDNGLAIELDVLNHPRRWFWPALIALTEVFELVNMMDLDVLVGATKFALIGQ